MSEPEYRDRGLLVVHGRTRAPAPEPAPILSRAQERGNAKRAADSLQVFDREEFVTRRFRPAPGEHLTVIGPTGYGKTRLLDRLSAQVFTPEVPGIVLAMKPKDTTMDETIRNLDLKKVRDWPPPLSMSKPHGYALWPKHTFDPDVDDQRLFDVFRRCILDSYKRGRRIVQADEFLGLVDLGLARELIALWTRGRSMGVSLWGGSQKPTHIPLHAYSQASHLFLGPDPTEAAQKRFAEIGGVDPWIVRYALARLEMFQWLYIRRQGGRMCIVDK